MQFYDKDIWQISMATRVVVGVSTLDWRPPTAPSDVESYYFSAPEMREIVMTRHITEDPRYKPRALLSLHGVKCAILLAVPLSLI